MWTQLIPSITKLYRQRFENEFYANHILTALREINTIVKAHVQGVKGQEYELITQHIKEYK